MWLVFRIRYSIYLPCTGLAVRVIINAGMLVYYIDRLFVLVQSKQSYSLNLHVLIKLIIHRLALCLFYLYFNNINFFTGALKKKTMKSMKSIQRNTINFNNIFIIQITMNIEKIIRTRFHIRSQKLG